MKEQLKIYMPHHKGGYQDVAKVTLIGFKLVSNAEYRAMTNRIHRLEAEVQTLKSLLRNTK
ncbi:proline utilization transcription activatoR [Caudoviricetes sp.]|nr:proline utilization transcription activatoR [Caudoviricetes sp.]